MSFANSAGGQIIYGITEKNSIPQAIDDGVDPLDFTCEWIDQIVTTNSSPRLQNLSINTIDIAENPRKVAYVLNIPQSTIFAPHQSTIDYKYYRRFESRSVPMADYEIRDALRRNDTPVLEVEYLFSSGRKTDVFSKSEKAVTIRPVMRNLSTAASLYSMFDFFIDDRFYVLKYPQQAVDFGVTEKWGIKLRHFQTYLKIPENFPLVYGISSSLNPGDFELIVRDHSIDDKDMYLLAYNAVSAPGSITIGAQVIQIINDSAVISSQTLVSRDGKSQISETLILSTSNIKSDKDDNS